MANRTRGIDILSDILANCDLKTQTNIVNGLTPILEKEKRPDLISELRKQLILFDDLAYANQTGLQLLLKFISVKDLAISLKNAHESVITNIAKAMSKNMFSDLKSEIIFHKDASQKEINLARESIIKEVKTLIKENRLYIDKPDYNKIF